MSESNDDLLQRALDALDDMESRLAAAEQARSAPIAIVGMGVRLPGGATSPEALWELLESGQDAVTEIPDGRWDVDAMFDPDPGVAGMAYTKWGGFISDVDRFDATFFGISPREAVSMDPQQRILLEVAWEAMEDAGIAPSSLAGTRTGIFVGQIGTEYSDLALQGGVMDEVDAYFASGVAHSITAGRMAYVYDFTGPAVTIDTACSSSLVATHLAVQALRAGECDAALAGGVSVMLSPDAHIMTSQARMMSFEGRCKTFDAGADGYVRGEGCALVMLKRLDDARHDGDPIVGVIRGTAMNQDGRSNGLTAPSATAQETVIRAALADAAANPADVGFVECHGTGTTLGDPIEIQALQAVYGAADGRGQSLAVQSIKTNIGHLEAAAGIAGLCKLVLALQRGELPQHLHLDEPNPYIPWESINVRAEPGPIAWPGSSAPSLGAVSSFGFSGTNVHMVVEQGSVDQQSISEPPVPRTYLLSAATEEARTSLAASHAEALETVDEFDAAVATAARGRSHLSHRQAVVAQSAIDAAVGLRDPDRAITGVAGPRPDGVAFLFTGQGSQRAQMGAVLHAAESAFRSVVDDCAARFGELGLDLLAVMFGPDGDERIHDTRYTQPALFTFEVAMAAQWAQWGLEPSIVLGHSIGEIAAAHVAGVFSLDDAVRIVEARGRLMAEVPGQGAMFSVVADRAEVDRAVEPFVDRVSLAGINGPRSFVVAGFDDDLNQVAESLRGTGHRVTTLQVSHGFHSPQMDPMLDEFEEVLRGVEFCEPSVDLVSNRTGDVVGPGQITRASYWRDQVRGTVLFWDGIQSTLGLGFRHLLEVGPDAILTGIVAAGGPDPTPVSIASSRRSRVEDVALHSAVGELFVAGVDLDWSAYAPGPTGTVRLPTYPFADTRYWHERVDADKRGAASTARSHGLAGEPITSPNLDGVIHRTHLSPTEPAWVGDHVIYDQVLFPATGHVALMLDAAGPDLDRKQALVDIRIEAPLILSAETEVQTSVHKDAAATEIEVHSLGPQGWTRHATAQLGLAAQTQPLDSSKTLDSTVDPDHYYDALRRLGVDYGEKFRPIQSASRADGVVKGVVAAPERAEPGVALPAATADGFLQLVGLAMPGGDQLDDVDGDAYVPIAIESLAVVGPVSGALDVEATLRPTDDTDLQTADVAVSSGGQPVVVMRGVQFRRASRAQLRPVPSLRSDLFHTVDWFAAAESETEIDLARRWLVVDEDPEFLAAASAVVPDISSVSVADLPSALEPAGPAGVIVFSQGGPTDVASDLASVVRAIGRRGEACLTVVTSQAARVRPDDLVESSMSGAWAVARVARNEYPELPVRVVDLSHNTAAECSAVLADLFDPSGPAESAWRDDVRFSPKVVRPDSLELLTLPEGPYDVVVQERGQLDGVVAVPMELPTPDPGSVVIEVRATGVNFRDVLNVLGQYAGEAGPLGGECVGEVVATGEGVERVAVGDRVMAVADASFASYCVVPQDLVARVPDGVSDADAATLPIAYLTAHHAMVTMGRLAAGDRVLIHAATGGVGTAAVRLAQAAGAEVFATAGSPAKRALLAEMGVVHVYDSRSLDFGEEIRRDTADKGIDLILNSLTGEAIGVSVEVLAPAGRFCEIGLAGIWSAEQFADVRPDAEYHVLYLGDICVDSPATIASEFDHIADRVGAGDLAPLPITAFELPEIVSAFRHMAQARHVGKVVITAHRGWTLGGDGAWLVTGGTGGLGWEVARSLLEEGADRVVVAGRSEPSAEVQTAIESSGGAVEFVAADAAVDEDLAAAVAAAVSGGMRLRGVVHAAGVVDDGLIASLTEDQFVRVATPKVEGARALFDAVDPHHPDHVVLFSAGATLFGAAGQANYAAANGVMDALVHERRQLGRPAQSIAWGPWATVGMAARLGADAARRWEAQGIVGLDVETGVAAFLEATRSGLPYVAVLDLRWSTLLHHFSKHELPALFSELARAERASDTGTPADQPAALAESLASLTPAERRSHVFDVVREQVLKVLGLNAGHPIQPHDGLTDIGMDSLMAVELSNRLSVLTDVGLPSTLAFEYPTLGELSGHVADELGLEAEPAHAHGESEAAPDDSLAELSADELTEALMQELDETGY